MINVQSSTKNLIKIVLEKHTFLVIDGKKMFLKHKVFLNKIIW